MKRYNSGSDYYKKFFTNRVQKISIDAGFTCPNRDGSKARGGCTYCDNNTFKPFYCSPEKSVKQQLTEGFEFFSKKYKNQQYLAYFQSFTNTYAAVEKLKSLYYDALSVENVVGLVISTRPDCFDEQIADLIAQIAQKYFVLVEFGVETTNDETLIKINRHHTFKDVQNALYICKNKNIRTGIHVIFGLPEESKEEMIQRAEIISELPFDLLKLHQLQIVKNTKMAIDYQTNPQNFKLFGLDDYIELVIEFLEHLSPQVYIDRFTSEVPSDSLIAPRWGNLKNYEIVHKINKRLELLDTWQGKKFNKSTILNNY